MRAIYMKSLSEIWETYVCVERVLDALFTQYFSEAERGETIGNRKLLGYT
jgi:hypothetical protein